MLDLFTIGHSTRDIADFADLLARHSVNAIADVRSRPYSRYIPQYNRDDIARELKNRNIAYVFLGDELGARSENPACYENDKVDFARVKEEESFQRGLARLKDGAGKYRIALMCAEEDPITCHRMILVTRQLRDEFAVQHIRGNEEFRDANHLESNDEAECRLLKLFRGEAIAESLIEDSADNHAREIASAYKKQGKVIAYKKQWKNG